MGLSDEMETGRVLSGYSEKKVNAYTTSKKMMNTMVMLFLGMGVFFAFMGVALFHNLLGVSLVLVIPWDAVMLLLFFLVAYHTMRSEYTASELKDNIYERGAIVSTLSGTSIFVPWGRFLQWEETSSSSSMSDLELFVDDPDLPSEFVEELREEVEKTKKSKKDLPDLPTLTIRGNGSNKVVINHYTPNYAEFRERIKERVGNPEYDSEEFERRMTKSFTVWIPAWGLLSVLLSFVIAFMLVDVFDRIVGEGDWVLFLMGMAFSILLFLVIAFSLTYSYWAVPEGGLPYVMVLMVAMTMLAAYLVPLMYFGTDLFVEGLRDLCIPTMLVPFAVGVLATLVRLRLVQSTGGKPTRRRS